MNRLAGTSFWLMGKQTTALKHWKKSVNDAKSHGYRVELSRTCFEAGKRLSEPQSKHDSLDGINAKEYLAIARRMFEEMDLHWDLDQLDRIESGHLNA